MNLFIFTSVFTLEPSNFASNICGLLVRKMNSVIHRMVIFSNFLSIFCTGKTLQYFLPLVSQISLVLKFFIPFRGSSERRYSLFVQQIQELLIAIFYYKECPSTRISTLGKKKAKSQR